jgi:hypothetical protein
MYHSDYDQSKAKSIQLDFVYNLTDKNITISRRRFNRLCYTIADTMQHEIIHMRQFRKRKFKLLPGYNSTAESQKIRLEQEYLGDPDEVDAYSYNIACELYCKFDGNQKRIVNYLNEDQQGKRRTHNSWRMYLKAFGHDHNHRIIKRVKKRVIYYLPKAANGRPFRACDWY